MCIKFNHRPNSNQLNNISNSHDSLNYTIVQNIIMIYVLTVAEQAILRVVFVMEQVILLQIVGNVMAKDILNLRCGYPETYMKMDITSLLSCHVLSVEEKAQKLRHALIAI